MLYGQSSDARSDALGTVDRFGLAFQNQRVEKLKLLKVVDLTSYRVSTSAPAITAEARRSNASKIPKKSTKLSPRLPVKVAIDDYNFDYIGMANRTGRAASN